MKSKTIFSIIFIFTFYNLISCTQRPLGKVIQILDKNQLNEEDLKTNEEDGLNKYIIKTDKSIDEIKNLLNEEHLLYLNDKKFQKSMKKTLKKTVHNLGKEINKMTKDCEKEGKKFSKKISKENKKSDLIIEELSEVSEDLGNVTNLVLINTNKKNFNLKDDLLYEDSFSYAYSIIVFLIVLCLILLGIQILFSKDKNTSDYTLLETDNPQEFTLKGF
jgi:predicted ribosome quality control (RQC) complex YloA/Tae2 family protein